MKKSDTEKANKMLVKLT